MTFVSTTPKAFGAGEMESLVIETPRRVHFHRAFNNTVTERVEYLDCTSNDLKDFVFVQELIVIRVHSC